MSERSTTIRSPPAAQRISARRWWLGVRLFTALLERPGVVVPRPRDVVRVPAELARVPLHLAVQDLARPERGYRPSLDVARVPAGPGSFGSAIQMSMPCLRPSGSFLLVAAWMRSLSSSRSTSSPRSSSASTMPAHTELTSLLGRFRRDRDIDVAALPVAPPCGEHRPPRRAARPPAREPLPSVDRGAPEARRRVLSRAHAPGWAAPASSRRRSRAGSGTPGCRLSRPLAGSVPHWRQVPSSGCSCRIRFRILAFSAA